MRCRFGGSGSWYYSTLAGLGRVPGSRSWAALAIAPPAGDVLLNLTWASASIDTPMGLVAVSWAAQPPGAAAAAAAAVAAAACSPAPGDRRGAPAEAPAGPPPCVAPPVYTLAATVPVGGVATVRLPVGVPVAGSAVVVVEGAAVVWSNGAFVPGSAPGVTGATAGPDGTSVVFSVGSGAYAFEARTQAAAAGGAA